MRTNLALKLSPPTFLDVISVGKCIFAFVAMLSLSACVLREDSQLRDCSAFDREYFSRYEPEQLAREFVRLSRETQYEMFICGQQRIEPPATFLARAFASEGPAVVPLLAEKLRTSPNDLTTRDIVAVFQAMALTGSYEVRANASLLHLLREKVDTMSSVGWRTVVQRMLRDIEDPQEALSSKSRH